MRLSRVLRASLLSAIASLPFVSLEAAATTAAASPSADHPRVHHRPDGQGAPPRIRHRRLGLRHGSTSRTPRGCEWAQARSFDHRRPDESSEITTAVQGATRRRFGIVSQSPSSFLAAKYPERRGCP